MPSSRPALINGETGETRPLLPHYINKPTFLSLVTSRNTTTQRHYNNINNSFLHQDAPPTHASSLKHAFSSPFNLLLFFVPLGILAKLLGASQPTTFFMNFIAIMPLAKLLGTATEELSFQVGETMGGLLNATFGNAIEFIIALFALMDGLIDVVQASLLGSILSNLLLVLGCCFLFGGAYYQEQTFNVTAAQTSCSLLALSVLSLLLPAAFHASVASVHADSKDGIVAMSHGTALILLVVYVLYLIFQLKTHKMLFLGDVNENEAPKMTVATSAGLLVAVTIVVSVCAEFLVDSIEGLAKSAGISKAFIGLVLLPLVGNAAEHVTAVTAAVHNNINLAIAVAVGSSLQIALFLTPAMVVFGWCIGQPFTLFFNLFETCVLFISVLVTNYLLMDGKSNWLEGALLLATYAIIALSFWHYPGTD